MNARGRRRPSGSHGFVLPFVMLVIAAVSIVAFGLTADGLRSLRGVRDLQLGDDLGHAADAAIAGALAAFESDSLWLAPIGAARVRAEVINGYPVAVEWRRSHPLVATLRAIARHSSGVPRRPMQRDRYRAVWLSPPALPVVASLVTNGMVGGAEGARLSGIDRPATDSPCGTARDTQSVAAVSALGIRAVGTGSWSSAPIPIPPVPTLVSDVRRAVDALSTRLPPMPVTPAPRPLPPSRPWAGVHLRGDTIAIAGPVRFTGLLVAQGPVVLHGDIRLAGLFVATGPVDATQAQLSVQGAVLSADTNARGVLLGARTELLYDRCAVQTALAAVARPSLAPFSVWHSLPQ